MDVTEVIFDLVAECRKGIKEEVKGDSCGLVPQ